MTTALVEALSHKCRNGALASAGSVLMGLSHKSRTERACRSELPKIRGVLNENLMNESVDAYVRRLT